MGSEPERSGLSPLIGYRQLLGQRASWKGKVISSSSGVGYCRIQLSSSAERSVLTSAASLQQRPGETIPRLKAVQPVNMVVVRRILIELVAYAGICE